MDHDATLTSKNTTVNPADLTAIYPPYDFCPQPAEPLRNSDSAVDLTSYHDPTYPSALTQDTMADEFQFMGFGDSNHSSHSSSPSNDPIFSNSNSPGALFGSGSSPETFFSNDSSPGAFYMNTTSADGLFANSSSPSTFAGDQNQSEFADASYRALAQDVKPHVAEKLQEPSPLVIPEGKPQHQSKKQASVHLIPDRTKTRAETQIKMRVIVDPLEVDFEWLRFPKNVLAKPKHQASADEERECKEKSVLMETYIVCATAVQKPEALQLALRRAAGEDPTPKRPVGTPIADLRKDDPAHPQNGGEVRICDNCKERERKRFDRKKKRADDEEEWFKYDGDRIIMINEKEYSKWKEVDPNTHTFNLSRQAKQVEFNMRIACYCRHQEEKTPSGYRVVFTFRDSNGTVVAQKITETIHITDDHKNREVPADPSCHFQVHPQYMSQQAHYRQNSLSVVPDYHGLVQAQPQTAMNAFSGQVSPMTATFPHSIRYSAPPTPATSTFPNPMSPMDCQFSQPMNGPVGSLHTPQITPQNTPLFRSASMASMQFGGWDPAYADTALISPTTQFQPEPLFLSRPGSFDNIAQMPSTNYSFPQYNAYASAPPSASSTPHNLSRAGSPTLFLNSNPTKRRATNNRNVNQTNLSVHIPI